MLPEGPDLKLQLLSPLAWGSLGGGLPSWSLTSTGCDFLAVMAAVCFIYRICPLTVPVLLSQCLEFWNAYSFSPFDSELTIRTAEITSLILSCKKPNLPLLVNMNDLLDWVKMRSELTELYMKPLLWSQMWSFMLLWFFLASGQSALLFKNWHLDFFKLSFAEYGSLDNHFLHGYWLPLPFFHERAHLRPIQVHILSLRHQAKPSLRFIESFFPDKFHFITCGLNQVLFDWDFLTITSRPVFTSP